MKEGKELKIGGGKRPGRAEKDGRETTLKTDELTKLDCIARKSTGTSAIGEDES